MITMRVKLFGFLARWSEEAELVVSIEAGTTVADLLYLIAEHLGPEFQRALLDRHGNLHGGLEVMLNQQHISARRISEIPVWEDGRLAIMPLVGGGHIRLSEGGNYVPRWLHEQTAQDRSQQTQSIG